MFLQETFLFALFLKFLWSVNCSYMGMLNVYGSSCRHVTLWLVYSLFPAVIDNILNVLGSSLCGHRCYVLYLWFGLRGGHCVTSLQIASYRRKRSTASRHLHCCTAALSNVQKSTVSRNPHNTVVKLRPYLLDFVS